MDRHGPVKIDGVKITGGVMLLVAAGLALWAVRSSGGLAVPQNQTTEGLAFVAEPVPPNWIRPELYASTLGVVYTKHRYPRICGQELTTIMHYGHSQAAIPATQDSNWMTSPPSEVTI
jgi:hypothetical protein